MVKTANVEVQTHEEATVYVQELDIFLTMKVLENTPAVLSLGKLCDENGYSYECISGQNHISLKTGFGYNATRRTSFLSWFQACQRVLPPVLVLHNLNDTFKTGKWSSYISLELVYFTDYNSIKRQWDSREGKSEWDRFPSSARVKPKCWSWLPILVALPQKQMKTKPR